MADQVRDIEKRQWAINHLKREVANDNQKWDPAKQWNPDLAFDTTQADNLKTLEKYVKHFEL